MRSSRPGVFVAAVAVLSVALGPISGFAAPGDVRRVSSGPGGLTAQGTSTGAAVSADGRFVVFDSDAANIVAADTNLAPDVFVYDRGLGAVSRVSVGAGGAEGDAGSDSNISAAAPISSDGRYVAFSSVASNLVSDDSNALRDVFVRDRTAGTTTRASVPAAGGEANGVSVDPAISADGRTVVFESTASNLVAGDTNGASDIFVRDIVAGTTTRASVATGGTEASAESFLPAVSGNGRLVVWYSYAPDLVGDDTNALPDVFLRDLTAGTTTRISVSSAGAEGDDGSFNPSISSDGRRVVFRSASTTLAVGDANLVSDVFVRDLVTGTTTRVSVSAGGDESNAPALPPSISADGRFVGWGTLATNLIPGDTNSFADVFVHDLVTGALRRVSVAGPAQATEHSIGGSVADGGGFVAFDSRATDFSSGDSNDDWDAFLIEPDVSAPAAPVVTSPAQGSRPTTATVTVSGTAEPRSRLSIREDGVEVGFATAEASGAWSAGIPFAEGPHHLTARASDVAGNIGASSPTRDFVVDLGPPVTPVIVSPAEGGALAAAVVTVSGTSEPGTTVAVTEGAATLGTTAATSSGGWSMDLTFAEGSHAIRARATDAASNTSPLSAARTFAVDFTPPAAPVISVPAAGASVGAGSVVVSGTAEPGTTVSVLEGTATLGTGATGPGGGWSVAAAIASKGLHTIVARARDAAANTGPPSAPRSFTVTTPAPVLSTPAEGRSFASGSVVIGGMAEPGATVEVRRDGGVLVGSAAAVGGTWSLTALFAEGMHSLAAVATGSDGWVSPPSAPRTFTVDTIPPGVPSITAPAAGATLASTVVTFAGGAEPGATVFVMEGAVTVAAGTADGLGVWRATGTLTPGSHTVVAVAADLAGNRSAASPARTFAVSDLVRIVTPAEGSYQPGAVTMSGTAPSSASLVRVFDGVVEVGSATMHGEAWSLTHTFTHGAHALTARAVVGGVTGPPTAPRTFVADTKRPNLTLSRPAGYVLFGVIGPSGVVRGTSEELDQYDSGVARVRVEYFDFLTGAKVAETPNACTVCPTDDAVWTDRPLIAPGLYRVQATAIDVVDNVSPAAEMNILLL